MKKFILATVILASSTQVTATNGDNLIGVGPISRALGGTGTALRVGAENTLKNPALLETDKDLEVEFGATYFMPTVTSQNLDANLAGGTSKEIESEADAFAIPAIGVISKISENMNFGVGAYGVSGLGVDFRDENSQHGLFSMSTSLSLFKLAPSLQYSFNEYFSAGIGLNILHGVLSIAYNAGSDTGRGSSNDLGTGVDLGLAYNLGKFTFGFNYQSKISMEYKHQINNAATDFGVGGVIIGDKLSQPAEVALGVAYEADSWLATVDVKKVQWSSAEGYEEFGWKDQTVIALGAAYMNGNSKYMLGFSTANNPLEDAIKNTASAAPNNKQALNMFNLVGFPAIVQTHITAGYSHNFSNSFGLDVAYVMAPEEEETTEFNGGGGDMTINTKHSQKSFSIGGRWKF